MQVSLKQVPATDVAYLRHIGPYGAAVGAFWKSTFIPWLHANGLTGRAQYGIGHDDPSVTAADKCRYDTCVEVPAGFVAREPAGRHTLPGGRYAVASFEGTPASIGAAWTELFRTWLPASGLRIDARPCFEYYPIDALRPQDRHLLLRVVPAGGATVGRSATLRTQRRSAARSPSR